jgi:hypothetical protein
MTGGASGRRFLCSKFQITSTKEQTSSKSQAPKLKQEPNTKTKKDQTRSPWIAYVPSDRHSAPFTGLCPPKAGVDQAFEAWGERDVPVASVQHALARLKRALAFLNLKALTYG